MMAAVILPAQNLSLAAFQAGFESFATAVAGTLSSTATTGLNWSPAYIGQFPNFGVGVTVGASLIPFTAVKPVFSMLGVILPSQVSFIETYGVPVPALTLDGRIGGFVLPFDIGLKFGYLPPEAKNLLGSVQADYMMAGADVRLALLQDKGLVPALSISAGYSYFKGTIGLPGVIPGSPNIDITQAMNAVGYTGTHTLSFSSPDLFFNWQSNVFEAKIQLSKNLLFFVPHMGLSAAYGISSAGGGITSQLTYTGSGGTTLATVQQVFAAAGYPAPTSQGIAVSAAASGWAFRAFGGVDIVILFLHLDLSGTYNILTQSLGGAINLRVQL
jgi:hypothetical protein